MNPMHPVHKHDVSSRLLAAVMAVAAVFPAEVYAEAGNAAPDTVIPVHHVRLKGGGFEETHIKAHQYAREWCTAIGKPPEPVPPGERVSEIQKDIYYARNGVTTHLRTRTYLISPKTCKLGKAVSHDVDMRTSAGYCRISMDRRHAAGHCDIRPLLEGGRTVSGKNLAVQPTSVYMHIAGMKCRMWSGEFIGIHAEYCIASAGSFVGMAASTHRDSPGLLLKSATWAVSHPSEKTTDFEATDVTTDTRVPLDVMAPHIAGGFKVISSGGAP